MKFLKMNKGITLVALVVTIIVLIILAGVSISLVLGQDGVVQKAKAGRDNYAEAAKLENEQLANIDVFTAEVGDTTAPTGSMNMTGGEFTISATINLGENTDVTRTKYVFTTSNEPLGTDNESLYTDGTIESTNQTITKVKAAGTYYLHILAVSKNGFKDEIISDTSATSQGKKDFTYANNNMYNVTLEPGNYKLEVWGASGGGSNNSYNYDYGGPGGYSVGTISITEPTQLFVVVGGQGTKGTSSGTYAGGYNGGGSGNYYSGGGGGATHIGLKTGLLTTYSSDYQTKLIMVAGAGGGAQAYGGSQNQSVGGAGGGTSGIAGGTNSNWGYQSYSSGPGTQSTYGTNSNTTGWNGSNCGFGRGMDYYSNYIGGGGAGFYGGACGCYYGGSGAGGSGYVNTAKLTNAQTIAGNQQFPSTSGSTETGHLGNGYARITAVD